MTKTILVNKTHKVKENYLKKVALVKAKDIDGEEILVEKETYAAYLELKNFLKTKGIELGLDSAFRTLEYQQEIYERFIVQYGIDYANKIVAPVGTSEHHTGLALDICIKVDNKFSADNNVLMQHVPYYEKIYPYLSEFGFILRYPKGKEKITGYPFEPWHIRYVGKFVATIINENNYTLEEYLENFSGVVLVNKKPNMTSFDVVNEISKLFGIKRVGHTGTLDPLAEGVLIVTIGKATKIAELLTSTYKEYKAGVLLGVKTDTLDITGNIVGTKQVPENLNIEKTLATFKKTYLQEVPIYSAVKVAGKKLYEYARENKKVALPKKEVTIKEIELLNSDKNTFLFRCLVSKGCYIRSLINDIATSLNTYASMTTLIRTKQGKISLEETSTLEEIRANNYRLYTIDEVLDYPVITVDQNLEKLIATGRVLENTWDITDKVIFKNEDNKLLGIYECKEEKLKVWKNFV